MRKLFKPLLLLSILFLAGCSQNQHETWDFNSPKDFNKPDLTIGYPEGHSSFKAITENLPDARKMSFNDMFSAFTAVQTGKIDAFAFDRATLEFAIAGGLTGVRILDENIGDGIPVVVGLPFKPEIPDFESKLNQFISEIKAQGLIQEIYERWVKKGSGEMPEIPVAKNPKYHLRVATTGMNQPFSYYKGTELTGLDVELARRLAYWLDADVEFKIYDWGGIIAAASSGDVDCIFSNLNATPERAESINFSQPIYYAYSALLVKNDVNLKYNSISEMDKDGVVLGMQTGFVLVDKLTREMLPKAKIEYYKTTTDMAYLVSTGKLDGFINDEPVIRYAALEIPNLGYIHCGFEPMNIVFCFPKSEKGAGLRDEMNVYIKKWREDGTLKKIDDIWLGNDESKKIVNLEDLDGKKGTLHLGTEFATPPFEYMKDGKHCGYEIDIIARFCREAGYRLEIHDVPFESLIMGVQTGMYDFVAACLSDTPAHRESLNLSEPIYESECVMAVQILDDKKTNSQQGLGKEFFDSLKSSFEKTFVREGRWRLIIQGIDVTIFISIFSAIFGTILGFGLCALRLSKIPSLDTLALVFIRLMQGLPMVVFLMILFYIVFAKSGIQGTWVAIIGFGMNFGAYVSEMIRTGILAVDKGQMEAALSLGYPRWRAFIKVVLPQAARHFLPVFQGEFISLVKMTSVVGYIAIQDLTKACDIIRSRTYEAFFPLITSAVIYFLIAWILTRVLSALQKLLDPRRKRKIYFC